MTYYPNEIYPVSKLLMTPPELELAAGARLCLNSCNVMTTYKEHSDTFKRIRRELGELLDYIEATLIPWSAQGGLVWAGNVRMSKDRARRAIGTEIDVALNLLRNSSEDWVLEKWLANPCPVELLIANIYGYTSDVEVTLDYLRNLKAQGWAK